jgi:hypothetical protein
MKHLIFCDLNHSLVEKVKAIGVEAVQNDYFNQSLDTDRAVLMTASNPYYTMGGGIDMQFSKNFPLYCNEIQHLSSGNHRIGNICFCVTVGTDYKATKEIVKNALEFAWANTYDGETLLVHGAGCGIGGLAHDDFIEILKIEILKGLKL